MFQLLLLLLLLYFSSSYYYYIIIILLLIATQVALLPSARMSMPGTVLISIVVYNWFFLQILEKLVFLVRRVATVGHGHKRFLNDCSLVLVAFSREDVDEKGGELKCCDSRNQGNI